MEKCFHEAGSLENPVQSLSGVDSVSNSLKILIVGDDPVLLEIARIVLESLGHQVVKRENSMGTTAEIVRERPDVVLMDVYTPVMSCEQLIRSFKEGTALEERERPVFFLYSGAPASELERVVKETGADGAIHKMGDALDFTANFAHLVGRPSLN